MGSRDLKGDATRYYLLVGKDGFDQSIYLEPADSRKMDVILESLVHVWHHLGLPEKVRFDNRRECCGCGHPARYLNRVIRLCLYLGIEPVFIPKDLPQRNGSVQNFNGRFPAPAAAQALPPIRGCPSGTAPADAGRQRRTRPSTDDK